MAILLYKGIDMVKGLTRCMKGSVSMKKRIIKSLSVIMCICICICFTPVFAFADEGTAGGESAGISENTSQANETPSQTTAPASQTTAPASQTSGDQNSTDQISNGQTSDPAGGEAIDENDGTVENSNEGASNSNDNAVNEPAADTVKAASGSVKVAIEYDTVISVTFSGINSASLIRDDYYCTFIANKYVDFESTSVEPVSISNVPASITLRYDKNDSKITEGNNNVILMWYTLLKTDVGNESLYKIDFNSFKQYNYEIPGYNFTQGSAHIKYLPDEESAKALGVSDEIRYTYDITNTYTPVTSADTTKDTTKDSSSDSSVTTSDTSAQTGDNMNFSLLAILGLLALACGTATVLTARRQER